MVELEDLMKPNPAVDKTLEDEQVPPQYRAIWLKDLESQVSERSDALIQSVFADDVIRRGYEAKRVPPATMFGMVYLIYATAWWASQNAKRDDGFATKVATTVLPPSIMTAGPMEARLFDDMLGVVLKAVGVEPVHTWWKRYYLGKNWGPALGLDIDPVAADIMAETWVIRIGFEVYRAFAHEREVASRER